MTLNDLIEYHEDQADYYKAFGANNVLTSFHREAAEILKDLHLLGEEGEERVEWLETIEREG